MSRAGTVTTYIIKKLWTTIAIALVALALLMSFLRYSLPYLQGYKDDVEAYISKEYAVDLSIGELSASWQSTGPALVLRDVRIQKGEQSPLELDIGEVYVAIEFWPSVISRKLQSSQVLLSRLTIDLDLQQIETSDSDFPILSALENIFLEQLSHFSMSDSRIVINSAKNSKNIAIEQLSWLNQANRHQGVGVFALQDFSSNNAKFILDLYGDVSSYSGTLYAEATDLNLSAWFNEFTGLESQLTASKGNVEVWARINDGLIERIDGNILPTTFDWDANGIEINNKVEGRFAASSSDVGWNFALPALQIDVDKKRLQADIVGNINAVDGLRLHTKNSIDLVGLIPMLSLVSVDFADFLVMSDFQGSLDQLELSVTEKGPSIRAQANHISWQESPSTIGLSQLSASLLWHQKQGKLTLATENAELYTQRLFDRNIPLQSLNFPVFIQMDTKNTFALQSGEVLIDGIMLDANAEYAIAEQYLSLLLKIDPFNLNKVPSLLPNELMGRDAKTFLTQAFIGEGDIERATLIWHGPINKYPFIENEGVFQAAVEVADADFVFSKGWPALTDLDLSLLFENQSLQMSSQTSQLDKVALSDLSAQIPNLTTNALLTINAAGRADSDDLTSLMLKSSLANSLGKLLANSVQIEGDLTTKLSLSIPLNDGTKTRAVGEVYLQDNQVQLPPVGLSFEQASGVVAFDNENISISGLQADLFGQTIRADLSGKQVSGNYVLDANFMGAWEASQIAQNVSDDFADYFSGKADWSLDLLLELFPEDFKYAAELSSNLIGVEANLPAPLGKLKNEDKQLLIVARGDKLASSVDLNLDNNIRFDGALAHKEKQFNRAHLGLGATEFESRGVGFSISGNFERMVFSEWYPLIRAITAGIKPEQNGFLGKPQRIFVDTKAFIFAGQEFTDVDVTTKRLDDQWSLDIDADQTRGIVTVFDDWYGRGINADLEYIRIPKKESLDEVVSKSTAGDNQTPPVIEQIVAKSTITIDPKTLPTLDITCKSCEIFGYDLGRLELEAEPNDDGLKLSKIRIDTKQGEVKATGQWYKRNQDQFTFVAGELNSKDFGGFLSDLGFDSGIQDSQADMSFALTWKDSPFDMRFENLDGEIDWKLSDGYLTEVSDKGSRIFTLLSLNSLVRKLSLDFRDVFAKGFFYDKMTGSVQITEGKADTRDTNIDGAAGEIEIYGYTDLAARELNYNVSFTPNVTGNLPVLVYFFTVSPPSALAALALDQMLTSAKVISNVNYSVTGTIANPILIETGRESTEVDLPARREVMGDEIPPFEPPTPEDFIKIEVKDGQSD